MLDFLNFLLSLVLTVENPGTGDLDIRPNAGVELIYGG